MNECDLFLIPSWRNILEEELKKEYTKSLFKFLRVEAKNGKKVYPSKKKLFNALNLTSIENVKVVIIGQDPYHGEGQAHGLSFSVEKEIRIPPSLRNIYKELNVDVGCKLPDHGNLTKWAEQGVLLLNSVLSVTEGQAASHKNKGWERFTSQVISEINSRCSHVVFLLWGAYAQKKGQIIDQNRHLVLSSVHPSPLSAHRGFMGCKHFSKTNRYLKQHEIPMIDWQID